MKHTLRKYLSNRGSALFMVVSTMAALILLVTAMYMSVVSSRQVQITYFNQEQAYISASSMGDAVAAFIVDDTNSSNAIVKKIYALGKGKSISTNGNDFKSLVASGTKDDTAYGAYDITITRLNDENMTVGGKVKDAMVYDIAVTVVNDGVVETSHVYVKCTEPDPVEPPIINRFFTGTGYVPNDIYISSFSTDSELYFDNEYVIFDDHVNTGTYSGDGDNIFTNNLICVGSVMFNNKSTMAPDHPLTWVIGNDMTVGTGCSIGSFDFGGTSSEHGRLIVGGDLVLNGNRTFPEYTDVYVGGDLYVAGYMNFKSDLYVCGDIIFMPGGQWWSAFGNLYIDGSVKAMDGATVCMHGAPSTINMGGVPAEARDSMNSTMNSFIQVNAAFPKWDIDTADFESKDIKFNTDDTTFGANAKYIHYIDKDCTIGKVKDIYDGFGTSVNLTIVIDTGDDPNGFRYLSVEPNCDDIGVSNTFMWYPEASPSGGKVINIVTVGCGTLVIDVPEGVTYQASDQEFFGHIGWFMMAGGSIQKTAQGAPYFSRGGDDGSGFDMVNFAETIKDSKIVYSTDVEECSYLEYESDGEDEKWVECTVHGGIYKESKTIEYTEALENDDPSAICPCIGRLVKSDMDAYFGGSGASAMANIKKYYNNYYGEYLNASSGYSEQSFYPNVNIYIVSVLENADIQFGVKKHDGGCVMNNVFFGYVYAPYMTFISIGGGGGLKNVGGLVVSDISLNGAYKYLFVQPDFRIDYIFKEHFEALSPAGGRVWRYDGV